jgi:DNA processing protein
LIKSEQVTIVTCLDDSYPPSLREIADAPIVLYAKGKLPAPDSMSMAIVGSRKASLYGLSNAHTFAMRLAELGFTIVSGLARGIDTAAHNGALKARGITVAVLGGGLANMYPPENRKLADDICEAGTILSEFPMETPPVPYNFPRRNRIISGLSLGVIVVEAAQRSGALITADFALEQGREVFAVPGKIDHPASQGVHNLIKQGAKLVTSVDDILEDLQPQVTACLKAGAQPVGSTRNIQAVPMELSQQERQIYDHLSDRPVHIDELTQQCGSTVPVMSVLLQLELKRLVKQLPGKLFMR